MTAKNAKQAIEKGLQYIAARQQADGSFQSFSSSSRSFKEALSYKTVFVPALILGSLARIESPLSRQIRGRLAEFLLKQKSPHWSFNYWAADSPERQTHPYPDDLDDTFCALTGLYLHDPRLIDEAALAGAVKTLLAAETRPGGPYRTWLVVDSSEKVWLDVDIAVNCNAAYFLKLASNPLPSLRQFMEEQFDTDKLQSPYYPGPCPVIYYMSRAYEGEQLDRLQDIARRVGTDEPLTPLTGALLLSSYIRLGISERTEKFASYLRSAQCSDGSWPAEAFCIDPAREGKVYYHGAAVLTTAFALEALSLYEESRAAKPSPKVSKDFAAYARTILKEVETYYVSASPLIAKNAHPIVARLSKGRNSDEIIGLPYRFNNIFEQTSPDLRRKVLVDLGLASLYGWIAYTIYDDFVDDEGQPELLAVANVSMRQSLRHFSEALPICPPFGLLVGRTFDIIDAANAWELENCRFKVIKGSIDVRVLPEFGRLDKLAERSLGHTLSPLAILCMQGVMPDRKDFRLTQKALRYYLIAKQLNDDAHDWQSDLQKGHITWTVSVILREAKIQPGSYKLKDLLPGLQRQFWHRTLKTVCREMSRQTRQGRQTLEQVKVFAAPNVLTELLGGIDASVERTLAEQQQAKSFIKHYNHL